MKSRKSRKKKKKRKKESDSLIFDIVSLNKKGQIVIPSRIRKRMGLKSDSRLLIMNFRKDSLVLIKIKRFVSKLKELESLSRKIKFK